METIKNIFTVDVEEYYHAENILLSLPKEKIGALESRVGIGLHKLLDLLAKYNSKATFFVLGCVAEKNPGLIKEIAAAGHEIASHGYEHVPLHKHTPESFDEDLGRSIELLSGLTGQPIIGYRATSFSLDERMEWFFGVLKKHGIVYDSSLCLSFFRKQCRSLWKNICEASKVQEILELPPSYIGLGPVRLPIGGGYFRAYPCWLTKYGLDQSIAQRRTPPLFYIHPWELDPRQPRFEIPALNSFRHYLNLSKTEKKLQQLLVNRRFISARDFLNTVPVPV
jgi:polysaccharide deacetylase family protein (PEP-CTERM system associated)